MLIVSGLSSTAANCIIFIVRFFENIYDVVTPAELIPH